MLDLGILGGGQLARMMIYRSAHLGLRIGILDPDPECSASGLSRVHVVGGLDEAEALRRLAAQARVLTYDIEHLDVTTLLQLEAEGICLRPSPRVLRVVQDKLEQRRHLERFGLAQPRFWSQDPGLRPVVAKSRGGGYDGRGVQVLHHPDDRLLLSAAVYWEEYVPCAKELAVLGVVAEDGQIYLYPPVEMVFDPQRNICDQALLPARLEVDLARRAQELASATLACFRDLGLVGIMAVEMFLAEDGRLLVNEVAPRPHNSGHPTMEVADLCQFEAHVRAVVGLPLFPPRIRGAAWMKNLLGVGEGYPRCEGIEALGDPRVRLHLYAKPQCRDGRKMGHVTIVASTPEEVLALSHLVDELRVTGQGP